jgi:hypothetical protein
MKNDRRSFIKTAVTAGIAMSMTEKVFSVESQDEVAEGGKIGIIGLDTSHVVAFTKTINDGNAQGKPEYKGFKVVAAYPTKGSEDMPSSINRLEGFTNTVRDLGVEIVNSIDELLAKTDVILLESVDGRRHLDEALPVLKAGKRMFIDKPVAHNLSGAIKIFNESSKYKVPVFSCSTTRFAPAVLEIVNGKDKVGKVLGASTYCPAGMATGHLDMAFYGIHGIEALFTMMGSGCQEVRRISTSVSDTLIGIWNDGRTGIFNAVPKGGLGGFGGTVYGEKGVEEKVQILAGYNPMLERIIEFFRTGVVPVQPEQTLEIFAFMEAADESNLAGGKAVTLESVFKKAKEASI